MRYYIIAGEASGDLHASNLMKALKQKDANASFRVWGGDSMQQVGAELVRHYRDIAFMGFWEVAKHLKTILSAIRFCKKDILQYDPDVVILVDYPGFNLRIAQFAKQNHFKVVYYISPQIWAWKKNRVYKIKRSVDEMLVILPFEKQFYERFQVPVHFVGNPLLDAVRQDIKLNPSVQSFVADHHLEEKEIIAILPGSRKQEIEHIFPKMLEIVKQFPQYQFVVSGVNWLPKTIYQKYLQDNPISIVYNKTYDLLLNCKAAIVTSGTATLETALFNVPQVVCYKTSMISYCIARLLVKDVKYISLVNLIMNKCVITELIQQDLSKERLTRELNLLLNAPDYVNRMMANYKELHKVLGDSHASDTAANIVLNCVSSSERKS